MKIKLFLIAIFIGIWVVAQQKYVERDVEKIGGFRDASILLKSGETIHGKIRDQLYVGGYYIFKDNEGKKRKFEKFDIQKALIIYQNPSESNSGILYYLRIYPDPNSDESIYTQVLVDGEIMLLRFTEHIAMVQNQSGAFQNFGKFQHLLMNKEGKFFDMRSNNSLLSDKENLLENIQIALPCDELYSKVESNEIKKNQLEEIVYFYNTQCVKN